MDASTFTDAVMHALAVAMSGGGLLLVGYAYLSWLEAKHVRPIRRKRR